MPARDIDDRVLVIREGGVGTVGNTTHFSRPCLEDNWWCTHGAWLADISDDVFAIHNGKVLYSGDEFEAFFYSSQDFIRIMGEGAEHSHENILKYKNKLNGYKYRFKDTEYDMLAPREIYGDEVAF